MSMNSQPQLKLSTQTEQLASGRDAAMRKFPDDMMLIGESSAINGKPILRVTLPPLRLEVPIVRKW